MRLIGDGEKGGRGYGDGGRGRLYTYRYAAVTTRMTSALSWAAMRAILVFHNCEGQGLQDLPTLSYTCLPPSPSLKAVQQMQGL